MHKIIVFKVNDVVNKELNMHVLKKQTQISSFTSVYE